MPKKHPTVNSETLLQALNILKKKRVALFIVAYNAEHHIQQTLERIPKEICSEFIEIYAIDDASQDETLAMAERTAQQLDLKNFKVMKTPRNQGYGGNQKLGYTYAIEQNFDYVILLHGDGQYPPELLPEIISEFSDDTLAGVFGSRMMKPLEALKGGMPLYKWIGNLILTKIENFLMNSDLSEFHSGYRSYKVDALKKILFLKNSNDFHFDTDIIIQFFAQHLPIKEVSMPTHYGDEICRVNGFKYAWNCLKSVVKYRLHRVGLFYQPSLDIKASRTRTYSEKKHGNTLHAFIRNLRWKESDVVVDLGGNDGTLSDAIAKQTHSVTAVDIEKPSASLPNTRNIAFDLNQDFVTLLGKKSFDRVLALDVIEHLSDPEKSIERIHTIMKDGGVLCASTANISYILMRLTHLVGWFNYGKRGILDNTHHRLFTVYSFKHLLKTNGFRIRKVVGFGPPLADQVSNTGVISLIDTLSGKLARFYPSLFAFNFLIIAEKEIAFEDTYADTLTSLKNH